MGPQGAEEMTRKAGLPPQSSIQGFFPPPP